MYYLHYELTDVEVHHISISSLLAVTEGYLKERVYFFIQTNSEETEK